MIFQKIQMALSQIVISGNSTFPVRTAKKTAIWQSFFVSWHFRQKEIFISITT